MKTTKHILKLNEKLFTNSGIESKWTYLGEVEYRKYGQTTRRIINVKCVCGRIKNVQYNNIRSGKSICCGFDPCRITPNKHHRSINTSYNSLFYSYKRGAFTRELCFTLSIDEFKLLLGKNCYYCNSEPKSVYRILNSKTGEVRAGIPIVYNGIDRINNKFGYTTENSITCCDTCNKMKTNHDFNFFINHLSKILNHIYGKTIYS